MKPYAFLRSIPFGMAMVLVAGCESGRLYHDEAALFRHKYPSSAHYYDLQPVAREFVNDEFNVLRQRTMGFLDGVAKRKANVEELTRYLDRVKGVSLNPNLLPRDQDMERVLAEGGVLYLYEYRRTNANISGLLILRAGKIVYGGPQTSQE
ncbi:MAG: hypothetical protein IH623_14775 [Verrucomicrobia bacterium]|nr:hypothetical protein [Verrucomicrobiota bacterium]